MPRKAFLGDEDAAAREGIHPFDFVLAARLHCTVEELHQRMSQREWLHWSRYLAVKAQNEEMADAAAAARMRG
jgi:hypothetical protein